MPDFNPDPLGHPTFRPQFPLRPADLRLIAQQAAAAGRTADTGGENDQGAGMGTQRGDDLVPPGFYARLTAPPTVTTPANSLYNFIEVQDDGTGSGWVSVDGSLRGSYLSDVNTYNAYPLNGSSSLAVPGPPIDVEADSEGTLYYYVITATWIQGSTGDTLQSGESIEVGTDGFAILSWAVPAAVNGYTLDGFSIWRGRTPGGENILVASVSASTTTYSDDGGGEEESIIPGGNAGPIVWMIPISAWNYYKFIDTLPSNQNLPWVALTENTLTTIYLGREVPNCTLSGATITAPADSFSSSDNGDIVIGIGIPTNTTITFVSDDEVNTDNALTSGLDITVGVITGTILGYNGEQQDYDQATGVWNSGAIVWIWGANNEAFQPGRVYPCRQIDTDYQNVPIFSLTPGSVIALINSSTKVNGHYDATLAYWDGSSAHLGPNIWLKDMNN